MARRLRVGSVRTLIGVLYFCCACYGQTSNSVDVGPHGQQQLVISVVNRGGDVVQEKIMANTSEDIVVVEYQKPGEGTLVTLFIDFKAEMQIFKVLVLGEEERGQSQYQVMCFILRYQKSEFISSDAMSKLRQKNPGTIRHPEEDKGKEQQDMDLLINANMSHLISRHIQNYCSEASNSTYAREADLKGWASLKGISLNLVAKLFPPDKVVLCKDSVIWGNPCYCKYEVCIGWYPCGLKYCKGKDSSGRPVNYRCGIKTCRKCRTFTYYVHEKQLCLWDE